MQLALNPSLATGYKSKSQIARVITEEWAAQNLFCSACFATSIDRNVANAPAVDFVCGGCGAAYQLKSGTRWNQRIPDAGYDAMITAIRSDNVPNLLVMQYSLEWRVCNLILIPSFFFTETAIKKRKPLKVIARRAGWIGCNIDLGTISPEGKIRIIADGVPLDPQEVRRNYDKVRPIVNLGVAPRGWALNVLNLIHRLRTNQFELADVYAFERELCGIYPNNRHVRAKIRQQLQVLRDAGLIDFLGKGAYRIR